MHDEPRFGIRSMIGLLALSLAVGCASDAPVTRTPQNWTAALRQSAESADTLVVSIRGGCEESDAEPLIFRVSGNADIRELLNLLEVDVYTGEYLSLCSGRDTLEFVREGRTVATLIRTPLTMLTRDDEQWPGDAILSGPSHERMMAWFESRGFRYFREEHEAALEALRKEQEAAEAFVSSFPAEAGRLILESSVHNDAVDVQRILDAMPDSEDAWVAVFRSLGQLRGSDALWTMTDGRTRVVIAVAHELDEASFWPAVGRLSEDVAGQLGAARLYFREELGGPPADAGQSAGIVTLAGVALTHGFDENKPAILRQLAALAGQDEDVTSFLRRVAGGHSGTEINHRTQWSEEPRIRSGALLALALAGAEVSDAEWLDWSTVRGTPSDRAAVEIAGALLNRGTKVRAGHFRLESYSLGEAGIEVLSRNPGPESLGLLTAAREHPWAFVSDLAEETFARMVGESWERATRRENIDNWLATHPDHWLPPAEASEEQAQQQER